MRSGEDLIETLGSSYAAFTRPYEPCCQAEPHRGGRLGVRMEFFDPAPINAFNKTPSRPRLSSADALISLREGHPASAKLPAKAANDPATHGNDPALTNTKNGTIPNHRCALPQTHGGAGPTLAGAFVGCKVRLNSAQERSHQIRWTRQLPPAARSLEHSDSAAARVSASMRTRCQIAVAFTPIVVWTTTG